MHNFFHACCNKADHKGHESDNIQNLYRTIQRKDPDLLFGFQKKQKILLNIILSGLLFGFLFSILSIPVLAESMSPRRIVSSDILDESPVDAPEIEATSYALFDVNANTFLLGKEIYESDFPASTTKVLTALIALEKLNQEKVVRITREMYEDIPPTYQRSNIVEGELLKVEDLIYLTLLQSACDASSALAITIENSEEEFSVLMNERASQIGCMNTNFTNSYGFGEPAHTTNAHDMVLILAEALKNESFRKISTSSSYTIPPTNKNPEARVIPNANRFVTSTNFLYDHYIGGKTGYTDLSSFTLVSGAEKDGRTLIGMIFGSPTSEKRYQDMIDLLEYGFSAYQIKDLDKEIFGHARQEIMSTVEDAVASEQFPLKVKDENLKIKDFTVARTNQLSDYTISADTSGITISMNRKQQEIEIPIYFEYSDGVKDLVANYHIVLEDAELSRDTIHGSGLIKNSRLKIVVRILVVMLLIFVIFLSFYIFIHLNRRRKNENHIREPKIL